MALLDPFKDAFDLESFEQRGALIEQLWSIPCPADPLIVAKAAFWGIPKLFWQIACPDPLDLKFDRMGRSHRRRRKKWFRDVEVIDGKLLNTAGKLAFFRLGSAAQSIGFYFLIADAFTDYTVNWTSLAMQWQGCIPDHDDGATADPDIPGGYPFYNDDTPINSTATYDPNGIWSSYTVTLDSNVGWNFFVESSIHRHPLTPAGQIASVTFYLKDPATGAIAEVIGTTVPTLKKTDEMLLGTIAPTFQGTIQRQIWMHYNIPVDITGTQFHVYPQSYADLTIDPGECIGPAPVEWPETRWLQDDPLFNWVPNVVPPPPPLFDFR